MQLLFRLFLRVLTFILFLKENHWDVFCSIQRNLFVFQMPIFTKVHLKQKQDETLDKYRQ
jgi:hypothetical protein